MDAIDLVLTEFAGDKITDICTFSRPYTKDMQERIEFLRTKAFNKTAEEIAALPEFSSIHDDYVKQIADCINHMCTLNNIDKTTIDAIGFHGKTLDHNPPSKARTDGSEPYTLQIGSGQMLSDLTSIPVVYDFRSDPLMAGFDGAPLVPAHNAHICASISNGIYYNGGNTSNFAVIVGGKAILGTDAGPFNEYTDSYVRIHSGYSYDIDGIFGRKGNLSQNLLQEIFNCGRSFYELSLPKSGDPAFYYKEKIFEYISNKKIKFEDAVYTFEYAAAYIAFHALTLIPNNIKLPNQLVLFGGGWKNSVVRESFENLLIGNGFILPEHQNIFTKFRSRFANLPTVKQSEFSDYMEARLMADLARYKLENKVWEIPEIIASGKKVVCGSVAIPEYGRHTYFDKINRAAKGWQEK